MQKYAYAMRAAIEFACKVQAVRPQAEQARTHSRTFNTHTHLFTIMLICCPFAVRADMSDKSDSWGWATTMLHMMGRLTDMRHAGYRDFMASILRQGFSMDLSGFLAYEHQANFVCVSACKCIKR
jgi:hypothetical protein